MNNLFFFKNYLKSPKLIGAVFPSSRKLAQKMIEDVDFDNAKCIVEYGPGTGSFTEELVKRRKRGTTIIIVEYNKNFCDILKAKFENEENFHIVNGSAENIAEHLKFFGINKADYIVSGLPFASLPKEVSVNILNATKEIVVCEGKFITFQYTLFKKAFINKWFNTIEVKYVFRNIPPAYVFICSNQV